MYLLKLDLLLLKLKLRLIFSFCLDVVREKTNLFVNVSY